MARLHDRYTVMMMMMMMVMMILHRLYIEETKIKTKEHNNRQNVNICIRNWDTNREREKEIERF